MPPFIFKQVSGPGSPPGYLEGDCAELIVYDVGLADSECLMVENFLNTKYAIF
jgi:hypothetical protein